MKKEHEEKLFEDFPELYKGRHLSIYENLMPFGFECGDGWFDILWNLSQDLTKLDSDIMATQVKEKYGRLRFSIRGTNADADDRINKAQHDSATTCESCGKPAVLRNTTGWLNTLCNACQPKPENTVENLEGE